MSSGKADFAKLLLLMEADLAMGRYAFPGRARVLLTEARAFVEGPDTWWRGFVYDQWTFRKIKRWLADEDRHA